MVHYITSRYASAKEGKRSPGILHVIFAQGLVFLSGFLTIKFLIQTHETPIYNNYPEVYFYFFCILLSLLQALIMRRSILCIVCWIVTGFIGAGAVHLIVLVSDWIVVHISMSDFLTILEGNLFFVLEQAVFAGMQSIWLIGKKVLWVFFFVLFFSGFMAGLLWFIMMVD